MMDFNIRPFADYCGRQHMYPRFKSMGFFYLMFYLYTELLKKRNRVNLNQNIKNYVVFFPSARSTSMNVTTSKESLITVSNSFLPWSAWADHSDEKSCEESRSSRKPVSLFIYFRETMFGGQIEMEDPQ